jgi:hypothetical protein
VQAKPAAVEAVEDAAAQPDDDRLISLKVQLQKLLDTDSALAADVERMFAEAQAANVVVVSGPRAVGVGGDIRDSIVVTGDDADIRFRFANDQEFDALLGDQGLDDRRVRTIEFTFSVPSAGEYWDGLLAGTVRMSALVLGQPEETQQRIREAFDRRMEEFRETDGFVLPVSVKLASGRKP